jgi:hypothetical protein
MHSVSGKGNYANRRLVSDEFWQIQIRGFDDIIGRWWNGEISNAIAREQLLTFWEEIAETRISEEAGTPVNPLRARTLFEEASLCTLQAAQAARAAEKLINGECAGGDDPCVARRSAYWQLCSRRHRSVNPG